MHMPRAHTHKLCAHTHTHTHTHKLCTHTHTHHAHTHAHKSVLNGPACIEILLEAMPASAKNQKSGRDYIYNS